MDAETPDVKPAKARPAPKPSAPQRITEDQLRCKVDIACGFLDRNVPSHASLVKLPSEDDVADRWKFAEHGPAFAMVPPEIREAYDRALLNAANLVADYFGSRS